MYTYCDSFYKVLIEHVDSCEGTDSNADILPMETDRDADKEAFL